MEKPMASKAKKDEASVEVENLLAELIAEDSRLKAAQKQTRLASNGTNSASDEPLQIYRQQLRDQ
jgi:hypothetical protein